MLPNGSCICSTSSMNHCNSDLNKADILNLLMYVTLNTISGHRSISTEKYKKLKVDKA